MRVYTCPPFQQFKKKCEVIVRGGPIKVVESGPHPR